jgi:hypothetical protein
MGDPGSEDKDTVMDAGSFFLWQIFAYLKFFDPNLDDSDQENYYMEREWRVVGNVPFELGEVVRILIPLEYGGHLRRDLPGYSGQVQFLRRAG